MKKKIKILKSFSCSLCGTPIIGSEIFVDEANANDLINAGYASEVVDEKPKRKNASVDTSKKRKGVR